MATGYCTISDNPRYFAVPLGPLLHPCDNAPGTMTTRGNFYYAQQGSSVGTAVVTGMLALVLQQMAEEGTNLDAAPPLPSTLRAIAIHSAHDIVASAAVPWPSTDEGYLVAPGRGPDFVTGFGLVNAVDAVDIVKGKLHREDVIGATCEKRTYSLFVGHTGPDSITVTLAWDDIAHDAGIAYDAPLLVNDLDLVLIDPMGQRHYPWSVDQQITDLAGLPLPDDAQVCGADIAVARTMKATANPIMFNDPIVNPVVPVVTGHDHLNNVEQVKTPAIMGKWTVEVSGFYVETGPQKFSLIGVPGGLMLPFPPQLTCKLFPEMCSGFLKNICLVVPTLCDRPHYIPIRRNVLTLRFRSVGDRNIMQLSSLCFALTEDGGCASDSSHSTPVREIVLGPAAAGFGVELVDVRGKIVLRDLSAAPVKRLRIPKESGDLFLVIRPGKTTRPGANYQVPIRLVRQE